MKSNTLASAIINMMLMRQKPSSMWTGNYLSFKGLEEAKQLTQKNNETVFVHTMKVLDALTTKNPITLWAALFHDLGKLLTREVINGFVIFHGHPEASVMIARRYLSMWQEDPFVIDRVERLILTHMLDIKHANDKAARNLFGKVGRDNIENWFALREADMSAYPHSKQSVNSYIDSFRGKVERYRIALIRENDLCIPVSDDVMHISGE